MLLRKEEFCRRFAARVIGKTATARRRTEFDPSFSNIVGGFSSAVNAMCAASSVTRRSSVSPAGDVAVAFENTRAARFDRVRAASRVVNNPRLRCSVLAAYRDLACPEDSVQFILAHFTLPKSVRENISTHRYDSGQGSLPLRLVEAAPHLLEFIKPAKYPGVAPSDSGSALVPIAGLGVPAATDSSS